MSPSVGLGEKEGRFFFWRGGAEKKGGCVFGWWWFGLFFLVFFSVELVALVALVMDGKVEMR